MATNGNKLIYDIARINDNGRIVIPAPIRRAMGLAPGDAISLTLEGGVLRLEPHRNRISKIQKDFVRLLPGEIQASAELIQERSQEAAAEVEEWIG